MITSLIVCDTIRFNPTERCHHLGKLINETEVPTFPAILELHILARLSKSEVNQPYELELQFLDDKGHIRGLTEKKVVYNHRSAERVPGADINFIMKGLVVRGGNYQVRLYINGHASYDYPIHVAITDMKRSG
ncbi:DUF6941 family protein [Paenibacillus sp. FSL R7-0313]|uniref:DUF6941 family protein n=1 Tax=unclassified Paenibacillus TaxID=185978 RepID=UPI00403F8CE9